MSDGMSDDKTDDEKELSDEQLADVSGGTRKRNVGTADIQEISITKVTDQSSTLLLS
jgi:hypothetical protein